MDITRDNLLALIRNGLKQKDLSISALERDSGVPKDTVRDFLRGKTQILRADKLQKILRILEPEDRVTLSGYIGEAGEIYFTSVDSANNEAVECPPGFDAKDILAVKVKGDAMLPLFYDGWIIYYTRHDAPIPAITGGMQVPYNPADKESSSPFINKPCIIKLKNGRTFLRTLKKGSTAKRYTLVSYNAPDMKDMQIEWLARIVFIKPN